MSCTEQFLVVYLSSSHFCTLSVTMMKTVYPNENHREGHLVTYFWLPPSMFRLRPHCPEGDGQFANVLTGDLNTAIHSRRKSPHREFCNLLDALDFSLVSFLAQEVTSELVFRCESQHVLKFREVNSEK